jgi:hypothetical protein
MALDLDKFTDALKSAITAAGVYKLAFALVAGTYWFVATRGIIPDANSWEIRAAAFATLLFAFLWLGNIAAVLLDFFQPRVWVAHFFTVRGEKAFLRSYISSMTPKEREIIGYLLAHNQKLFIAAQDGGYALPLISQRIARLALQSRQVFDSENTPFVIPDHLWSVLVTHKEQFPHKPLSSREPDPWRIPWMAR